MSNDKEWLLDKLDEIQKRASGGIDSEAQLDELVDDAEFEKLIDAWNRASEQVRKQVRRETDLDEIDGEWSSSSAPFPWSGGEDFQERERTDREGFDTFDVSGRRVIRPTSVEEVRRVVEQATERGVSLKPTAPARDYRGHSFSNVNSPPSTSEGPDEYSISIPGMSGKARHSAHGLDRATLRSGVDPEALMAFKGGTSIRSVNGFLRSEGRALANIGSYDGQTIAGAVATDTHGSGVDLGPLSTMVRSLTLVTTGGNTLRIEPTDGITDRRSHAQKYPDVTLVQDDDVFHAVTVGLGCMGVVTSLVLETTDYYWLKESRVTKPWAQVKRELEAGAHRNVRHYEVAINPYEVNGRRRALVTTRELLSERPDHLNHDQRNRAFSFRMATSIQLIRNVALNKIKNKPERRGNLIHTSLNAPTDDTYISHWNNVLILGLDSLKYHSMEVGISAEPSDDWIETVDELLGKLDPDAGPDNRPGGEECRPTAPISLRFVGESDAWLSPQYGRETTCMIEMPFLEEQARLEPDKVDGMYRHLEEFLLERGGRPHWGKKHYMTWDKLTRVYDQKQRDRWMDAHARFNSTGVFDGPFTEQLGLSMSG